MLNLYTKKHMVMHPKGNKKTGDWHRADIKAALEKCGWTLSALSTENGYDRSAANRAFLAPWPKLERIIAEAIGVEPMEIWPSRYKNNGQTNRRRGRPANYSNYQGVNNG